MKTLLVVGSGTMGSGIAQTAAQHGLNVILHNPRGASAQRGLEIIGKSLARQVEKGKISQADLHAALGRITCAADFSSAREAEAVVEATPENLELKQNLFHNLDKFFKPEVLLGSATSGLSITEIAARTAWPDRVIGLHFFNPAPAIPLIEIVRGARTSDETCEKAMQLARDLGKTPVLVNDGPGFVVSRILAPMMNEAIMILGEGLASAEDIDAAMKLGARHPMGPLALADLVGLDMVLGMLGGLHGDTKDSRYRPAPLLLQMVRAGKLGRKSGEGFFKY